MKTIDYLRGTLSLEQRLERTFRLELVSPEQQTVLRAYIEPLRLKGEEGQFHYEHSVRVGIVGADIAHRMGLDPKVLLYAGLMHDIGKALVPVDVLGKTESWTKADSETMKPHVIDGYKLLR